MIKRIVQENLNRMCFQQKSLFTIFFILMVILGFILSPDI